MRCDNCGNADAVIQLTKVKDNEMRVLHLCEACAADEGVEAATEPASPTTVHLADFLAQIGKSIGEEAVAAGRCPACGLTPAQLKQTGRLGCATCYTHVGKVVMPPNPEELDRKARVDSLRRSLQRAVDSEDFEHAAALRDQIRRLEEPEGPWA